MRWPGDVRRGDVVFALVGLPLAVAAGLFAATILYLGALLAITIVGLPLVAGALRIVREIGSFHRRVTERLLGERIADPPRLPPATGPLDWLRIGLTDGVGWRTLLYLVIRLPVAVLTFLAGFATWTYGAFLVCTPVLWLALWRNEMAAWNAPVGFGAGVVALGLAPWATRASADLNRWLARALLSPPPVSARQLRLEKARNEVAADATATLRQIERDLHDGTQARLVAIALNLAMADEALGTDDMDRAHELMGKARSQLGEASTELRHLTRGINPVALEGGLEEALPTLAADAGMPTELHVDLAERPSPVIERVVYFCVAELITNAAKHSGADSVRVEVTSTSAGDGDGDDDDADRSVRLRVSDDGRGGARLGAGSGLRGLRDRVEAVDGRLDIASPEGGPTVITADLPVHL
jgi:signal transduction histidine kinase